MKGFTKLVTTVGLSTSHKYTRTDLVSVINKNALLDWIKQQLSFEQGFDDGEAEYGYKNALEEMKNYLNKYE